MVLQGSGGVAEVNRGMQSVKVTKEAPTKGMVKKMVIATTEAKNADKYVGQKLVIPEGYDGPVISVTRFDENGNEITHGLHALSCGLSPPAGGNDSCWALLQPDILQSHNHLPSSSCNPRPPSQPLATKT